MRYIVDGNRLVKVLEQDFDAEGEVIWKEVVKAIPFGHWIGPNHRRTMKIGHYGKPESYYRRRNTPKAQRA